MILIKKKKIIKKQASPLAESPNLLTYLRFLTTFEHPNLLKIIDVIFIQFFINESFSRFSILNRGFLS